MRVRPVDKRTSRVQILLRVDGVSDGSAVSVLHPLAFRVPSRTDISYHASAAKSRFPSSYRDGINNSTTLDFR